MVQVLIGNEKCAVVCPKNNNATILTIPLFTGKEKVTILQSYAIFMKIKNLLPNETIIPIGVGFAILIKRKFIDKHGLFDEIYGRGYNEENYIIKIKSNSKGSNRYKIWTILSLQCIIS